jgi:hypothetical protein
MFLQFRFFAHLLLSLSMFYLLSLNLFILKNKIIYQDPEPGEDDDEDKKKEGKLKNKEAKKEEKPKEP